MSHYIISLNKRHYAFNDQLYYKNVYSFLIREEPWSIIAMDALLHYGFANPQHKWAAELDAHGRIIGIIYVHENHVHFSYVKAPVNTLPLYNYIYQQTSSFITHGKIEVLKPIINSLSGYRNKMLDQSYFVRQTASTVKIIKQSKIRIPHIKIRYATMADIHTLKKLYQKTEIENQIDMSLIQVLIRRRNVIVAEKSKEIIGTGMILMESWKYALLGGLFVKASERKQQVATLLGQELILLAWMKNKEICFYYNDKNLSPFYAKGAFEKIGKWASYSVHKK